MATAATYTIGTAMATLGSAGSSTNRRTIWGASATTTPAATAYDATENHVISRP
jgi:hypothetical protein